MFVFTPRASDPPHQCACATPLCARSRPCHEITAANTIIDAVANQDWLDPVADTLQQAVRSAYSAAGEPGQCVKNFLHGAWLGHRLHPVLTDVPIGARTTAAVLDAMSDICGEKALAATADARRRFGCRACFASATERQIVRVG